MKITFTAALLKPKQQISTRGICTGYTKSEKKLSKIWNMLTGSWSKKCKDDMMDSVGIMMKGWGREMLCKESLKWGCRGGGNQGKGLKYPSQAGQFQTRVHVSCDYSVYLASEQFSLFSQIQGHKCTVTPWKLTTIVTSFLGISRVEGQAIKWPFT